MKSKQIENEKRRTYEKPVLRIIELETDQVLGVGCKFELSGSDWGDVNTCIGNFCSEPGS